jgi:iron complex outermembrane recepter protein
MKVMLRPVLIALAVLAQAVPGSARGIDDLIGPSDSAVVEGVVVDALNGRPLQGTLVRVVGLARQDVTHEGGEFHLTNLPAGRYTILFERLGYRREVRDVQLSAKQTVELNVQMSPSAIALPGLIVTGTTRATLGDRTVRPATVVSGQELTRRLDVTLATTLDSEPGIAVTSVGPATARPIIRGLGGDRVLVLEDGARVGDLSATSSDHALSVDPLNAERIEVVRGPTALLYGSNAIGGVINLIRDEVPASVPEQARGMLSMQGQSVNDGIAAGASAESGWGPFAVRGEGSYRQAGDLRTPGGRLDNTDLRTWSVAAGASRIGRSAHAGLAYRYYDNTYGIPGGFVGSHPDGVTIEMRRHALHGEAHLRGGLGPLSTLDIDGKYTNYHHREMESPTIVGTEYGLLNAAGEIIARHEALGPFESGAVGTRVGWRDFVAGGSTRTPPSQEWNAAVFVLEELGIGQLRIQGGARFDWHRIEPRDTTVRFEIGSVRTRSFGSLSGSLGALYSFAPAVAVGLSLARAYRTPDTGELFSQGPHLAAYSYEVGNPDLAAEVGLGLDVFLRLGGPRYQMEIAAFRNALDNYVHYRDTGTLSSTGLPVYQASGADALLIGFEASGSVEALPNTVLSGVVSHVRGEFRTTGAPLPMMPPLHGQLTARYDRPRYFAGMTWRATADQERVAADQFETSTQGHSTFDADVGLRWTAFGRVQSVTLRIDNIMDEVVYDHLSRIRDRETDARVPGAGRSASAIYRVVF